MKNRTFLSIRMESERRKVAFLRSFMALVFLLFTVSVMAQTTVNGRVKDKKTGEELPFVTVVLTKQGDSKPLKNAITDESGRFVIGGVQNGSYTVAVTFMGYKAYSRNIQATGTKINLGVINLVEEATALTEVTVTGQRAAVKLEVDRKSFDVSQDISNAGASASEVLENIPSVEVDQDGNVSLRGNESVEVWINGRASGLTADNRGDILKQIPAETIDRIEVIDNPSAKFSAEGSAGIINIILKKERKAGYFGTASVGGDTRGGANANVSVNYNSAKLDLFGSVGYRHMQNEGRSESEQHNFDVVNNDKRGNEIQQSWYNTTNKNFGNMLFARLGGTWHLTDKDDLGVASNIMKGHHNRYSTTPYYYRGQRNYDQTRKNKSTGDMLMQYYELNYRHTFSPTNTLDFVGNFSQWGSDFNTEYRDRTDTIEGGHAESYTFQPSDIKNKQFEFKLDYEGKLSDKLKLQAGYQAQFFRENTPTEQWTADNWEGTNSTINKAYYNRFIYNQDTHALYATLSWSVTDKFSAMAGLRGEYWKVKTDSYNYGQDKEGKEKDPTYEKDFLQLFPSVFLSYQLTKRDQLQVNYTRRLRRPRGGELNSFMNTEDPTNIRYGNPELTPEFSNSFSLNYLRQWDNHSLLVSAYYRPTTDVMSRVQYLQEITVGEDDAKFCAFSTTMNATKSVSAGLELTAKNKLAKILDITTTANFYNKHVDDFDFYANNPLYQEGSNYDKLVPVSGKGDDNFTWSARMQASLMLPWDLSVQLSGRYRSKEIVTQGYRNANFVMSAGIRKNFLNKLLTVSVNCRDLLNSRKRESFTDATGFTLHQLNRWGGRSVNLTLAFNFGNMMPKMSKTKRQDSTEQEESSGGYDGYSIGSE